MKRDFDDLLESLKIEFEEVGGMTRYYVVCGRK
jgi:hypothetical protein